MKLWPSMQPLKYIKSHHDGEPATKRHSGFPSLINVMGLPSRLSKAPPYCTISIHLAVIAYPCCHLLASYLFFRGLPVPSLFVYKAGGRRAAAVAQPGDSIHGLSTQNEISTSSTACVQTPPPSHYSQSGLRTTWQTRSFAHWTCHWDSSVLDIWSLHFPPSSNRLTLFIMFQRWMQLERSAQCSSMPSHGARCWWLGGLVLVDVRV